MEDVQELEYPARLVIKLRVYGDEDQSDVAAHILEKVGTLMIDTSDWRFDRIGDLREDIVEMYVEVD